MNCREAEQFFDAYLDGELAGSLRLEFDAHRLRCPVCQQKLAMMEACEQIIAHDARMPALSDDFAYRVMNEIRQRRVLTLHARRRRIVRAASVLLPAAAAVLLAVFWPFGSSSTSVERAGLGTGGYVAPEVAQAIKQGDKVELYDYISRQLDQAWAASTNLASDVAAVREYALNWTLSDGSADVSLTSPLNSLWEQMIPTPPADEVAPTPSPAGTFSL